MEALSQEPRDAQKCPQPLEGNVTTSPSHIPPHPAPGPGNQGGPGGMGTAIHVGLLRVGQLNGNKCNV